MDVLKGFGKRVKEARAEKKLTQAQVAEKIGVSVQTVSAYENYEGGKGKTPTLDNAVILAETLGVPLDYLCRGGTLTKEKDCSDCIHTLADVRNVLYALDRCLLSVEIEATAFNLIVTIDGTGIEELCKYYGRVETMSGLLENGTIDKPFYEDWLRDALTRLEGIKIFSELPF